MSSTKAGSHVEPYLFFGGRCEEALEFYRTRLGAQVEFVMRYDQSPQPPPPGVLAPGFEKKIMHASFRIGATRLMASDGCEAGGGFAGFTLSLTLPDEAAARAAFAALAEGGEIRMPISPTFWSPCFGMVADRFGMGWMVTVPAVTA